MEHSEDQPCARVRTVVIISGRAQDQPVSANRDGRAETVAGLAVVGGNLLMLAVAPNSPDPPIA